MVSNADSNDMETALADVLNGGWVRQDFYPDALAPAVREFGEVLADITSAAHILAAPLYAIGLVGKRTKEFLRRVLEKVPPEQRVKADPQYTAEILEAVRCREDGPLRDMFAQLLRTGIDKAVCANAHPAFPKILAQLCADEAEVLLWMARNGEIHYSKRSNARMSGDARVPKPDDNFPGRLAQPLMLKMYASHLLSLNLAQATLRSHAMNDAVAIAWLPVSLTPTEFGQLFLEACLTYEQAREW